MLKGGIILSVATAAVLAGCRAAPSSPAPAAGKVQVFVSILPQVYFVERIGGAYVAATALVGPGQSPHTFEPTPNQMAKLSQARLLLTIGWPFEKQLVDKVKGVNPDLRIVDTRQGIALRRMTPAEAEADADEPHPAAGHGPAGEPDPHFWLSPRLAKTMAGTIARALAETDPPHAAEFQKNLEDLQKDLDRLDATLAKALAPLKGKDFFVYHPAFGYFADAYGLRQVPVEIEGKEPTARQLASIIARAKAEGVRVIFVQPQFSAKSAEALARTIGGAALPMDDLARDYIANLNDMAEKVRKAIAEKND